MERWCSRHHARAFEPDIGGLRILREVFDGPLMAYPGSGYFKSPNWEFKDVIRPDDLAGFAKDWVAAGAHVLGGCCGFGPEHIEALRPMKCPGPEPS